MYEAINDNADKHLLSYDCYHKNLKKIVNQPIIVSHYQKKKKKKSF